MIEGKSMLQGAELDEDDNRAGPGYREDDSRDLLIEDDDVGLRGR